MQLKAELNLLKRANDRMLGEREAEAQARQALADEVGRRWHASVDGGGC